MAWIIAFSVVLLIAGEIVFPIYDPDLWWHLNVGHWILDTLRIPRVDYWTLFGQGRPWTAYSWLPEVLFASVERLFGPTGIATAHVVLAAAITAIIWHALTRISTNPFFALLLAAATGFGLHEFFSLRPQTLAWLLFVWALAWADRVRMSGYVLSAARAVELFCLFALWANTHLTLTLGLGAICAWLGIARDRWLLLGKVVAIALIGGMMGPGLGATWLLTFTKSSHLMNFAWIAEFGPATIHSFAAAVLILQMAIFLTQVSFDRTKVVWEQVALGVGLALMGAASVKFLPFALIAWGFINAAIWRSQVEPQTVEPQAVEPQTVDVLVSSVGSVRSDNQLTAPNNFQQGFVKLQHLYQSYLHGSGFAVVLLAMGLISLKGFYLAPYNLERTPKGAVDFIEREYPQATVLNFFGEGGYLAYRRRPKLASLPIMEGDISFNSNGRSLSVNSMVTVDGVTVDVVTVDGRTNVTPPEILNIQHEAVSAGKGWRRYLEVVAPDIILTKSNLPITTLLNEVAEWERVYVDQNTNYGYSVFRRRSDTVSQQSLP